MHLRVSYEASLARADDHDYLTEIQVEVMAFAQSPERQYVVGRLALDRLNWFDAKMDGRSLAAVCQANSPGWSEVYEILTDGRGGGEFRDDLKLEDFFAELFFIQRLVLHPDVIDRTAVIDAVIRAVTHDNSLVVMAYEPLASTPLTHFELTQLGFKKVCGQPLVLRDNHVRYPFGERHPTGRNVRLAATADQESWVRRQWDRDQKFHPKARTKEAG